MLDLIYNFASVISRDSYCAWSSMEVLQLVDDTTQSTVPHDVFLRLPFYVVVLQVKDASVWPDLLLLIASSLHTLEKLNRSFKAQIVVT